MRPVVVLLTLFAVVVTAGCNRPQKSALGPQEVHLSVTDGGFEPARAEVPRGQAFTLVVTRKTDQTCATAIVIPRLSQRTELPLNQPVRITIPAGTVTDTLNYA